MAARASFTATRLAAISSSAIAATAVAVYPWQKALADEGKEASPSPPPSQFASAPAPAAARLSIYDTPSEPITLIPEPPSALQLQVSSIRKTSEVLYKDTKVKLREVSNNWVGMERKVESEVKSILPPDEQLSPAILYVGISTLLGSIITRNRAFPLRFLTPPLFLIGSTNYFLPKTAHNLNLYISELEQQYIPNVYDQQKKLTTFLHDSLVSASRAVKSSESAAKQWTAEGRRKLEETSGLSLQSASKSIEEEKKV